MDIAMFVVLPLIILCFSIFSYYANKPVWLIHTLGAYWCLSATYDIVSYPFSPGKLYGINGLLFHGIDGAFMLSSLDMVCLVAAIAISIGLVVSGTRLMRKMASGRDGVTILLIAAIILNPAMYTISIAYAIYEWNLYILAVDLLVKISTIILLTRQKVKQIF